MSTGRIIYPLLLLFLFVVLAYGHRRVRKTGVIYLANGLMRIERKDPVFFENVVTTLFFVMWVAFAIGVLAFFFPPPWHVTAAQLQAAPPKPK